MLWHNAKDEKDVSGWLWESSSGVTSPWPSLLLTVTHHELKKTHILQIHICVVHYDLPHWKTSVSFSHTHTSCFAVLWNQIFSSVDNDVSVKDIKLFFCSYRFLTQEDWRGAFRHDVCLTDVDAVLVMRNVCYCFRLFWCSPAQLSERDSGFTPNVILRGPANNSSCFISSYAT